MQRYGVRKAMQKLRTYSEQETIDMLTSGFPNALYEISA
jgi:hypothetical protein